MAAAALLDEDVSRRLRPLGGSARLRSHGGLRQPLSQAPLGQGTTGRDQTQHQEGRDPPRAPLADDPVSSPRARRNHGATSIPRYARRKPTPRRLEVSTNMKKLTRMNIEKLTTPPGTGLHRG